MAYIDGFRHQFSPSTRITNKTNPREKKASISEYIMLNDITFEHSLHHHQVPHQAHQT